MTEQRTLQERIDSVKYMRDELRLLESQRKALESACRQKEAEIIEILEEQGLQKMATDFATVSISTATHPRVNPEHWPDVWEFIWENGLFELLRKQLNSGAFRELQSLGMELPYVEPEEVKRLNVRGRI